MITRKDISNIERLFGLRETEKHPDDAISTALWVEELHHRGDTNPVLLFKEQGKLLDGYDHLKKDNFMMILQTPLQANLMKKFAKKVVCIDSTHKTTGYDFLLITMLVVDEYGEGLPVAWCLSTREDEAIVTTFFQHIKQKVGLMSPSWIMTDDAEQFYNAWITTFNTYPQKLLCTWHVDHAWQNNLTKIKDKSLRCQAYHTLRILLEEPCFEKFNELLEQAVDQLETCKATETYGQYFHEHYYSRKKQSAICYRLHCGINTNMRMESFHNVLKSLYMKGKENKRVDKLISILLKISRDKAFERMIKLEKGISSS